MPPTRWIILIIVLSVGAAFGRLSFHEFTGWDDPHTIARNPHFNPPSLNRLSWYWTAIGEDAPAGLYIPFTYTVWGLLAKLAYLQSPDEFGIRLNPYVFHGANVVMHIVTALVVFAILRILVCNDWAAGAGALFWGLHPVQVEPVGWASGMKDLLCGLLSMIAIWQYLCFARKPGRWWCYALATLAFVAAMLSKPTAMVVPPIVLVLDIWGLRRPAGRALLTCALWFVLTIPCAIWTKASQSTIGVPTVAVAYRPLVATHSLAFYAWKLILPINLGVDYGHRPPRVVADGWLWFTWVVPVAVAVILWSNRRRAPLLVAAGLVFLAGVLPVLGFLPFQFQYFSTVADHYLYISMLGCALAVAWLVATYPTRLVGGACAAALVLLALLSFRQSAYWRDDITLFTRAIDVNPDSFVGYNNLGYGLFARGQVEEAEYAFRKSFEIFPDYATGHDNLALVLLRTNRREEAVDHIAQVLMISDRMPPALRPNLDRTHTIFGVYLMSQHRYTQAADHFRAALRINPDNEEARSILDAALSKIEEAATQPGE